MKTNIISIKTNIEHQNIINHIQKYKSFFEEIGELVKEKIINENGGRPRIIYDLNDNQIKFLLMLLKNNINTLKFKSKIAQELFNIGDFKIPPQKGHVYIIKNSRNEFKIGSSINPNARIRSIETQQGESVDIICISEPLYDYIDKEHELHKKYKNKRKIGEYFDLNDNDLNNIISELYAMSVDDIKKTITYSLYANDKESFIKLYLIELGKVLSGEKSNLYIFKSTLEIATYIFEKNKDKEMSEIYKILEKEMHKYLDLIFEFVD